MGPGLFFALLLATLPVRAERAVGLEALGIDPLVALAQAGRLDVRDALGRPVSARVIEAQLKQAGARTAANAAYASTLPQAAAIALLEMLQALRLALRGGSPSPQQRLCALAPPGGNQRAPLKRQNITVLALCSADSAPRFCSAAISGSFLSPAVLRC